MPKISKTVLGLDVGHHAVKLVVATANANRLRVTRAEHIPVPPGTPDISGVLRKWFEENKLTHLPVVSAVGGGRVMYQSVVMEKEDPRTPEQVAAIEAVKFSDMTDARMVHTVTPASNDPRERRLLISLARPELLQNAIQPLSRAGLRLVNACPSPVALYNGVTSLGEPVHQTAMFVDVGATHTEIVVGDGRGVLFARSFAMGAAQLTQSVATQAKLPLAQAERARLQAKTFAELPGESPRACEQFVSRWIRELNACLQIHRNGPGADREDVSRVVLSGGGVLWQPLFDAIKAACDLPVRPVGRIAGHEEAQSAEFMIAAGLAADGLGIGRGEASLLPDDLRALLTRERNKKYWLVTGLFSVAAVGMLAAATHTAFVRERAELTRQNNTLQRFASIRRDIESVEARMALIDEMSDPLARFVHNSARIRKLTLLIADLKGAEDFITFLGDSETYLELRVLSLEERMRDSDREVRDQISMVQRRVDRQRAERLRDPGMNRLIVEGFTAREDLSTVRALIQGLREHPEVNRADLLTDDFVFPDIDRDEAWRSTGNRRFVLDIRLVDAVEQRRAAADSPQSGRSR